MAKKSATGGKKTGSSKSGPKPRPKLDPNFLTEIKRLRGDLKAIVAAKKDQSGELSEAQLVKATRMLMALEGAEEELFCGQLLIPY